MLDYLVKTRIEFAIGVSAHDGNGKLNFWAPIRFGPVTTEPVEVHLANLDQNAMESLEA
jgi:hypothetical protein